MVQKSLFVILLLFVTLSACRKDNEANPIFIIDVADDFHVDMRETLNPDEGEFQFVISTIDKQACENTQLDYQLEINTSTSILSLNDLIEPGNCIQDSSVITEYVNLGNLENGEHKIQINIKDQIINEGKLKKSDDKYQLSMKSHHGIAFLHDELYRIPDQTIWGTIAYADASSQQIVDQLLEDFGGIADFKNYSNGFYGHFTIEDEVVILPESVDYNNAQTFIMDLEQPVAELKKIIEDYRDEYGNELELSIFSWEGDQL